MSSKSYKCNNCGYEFPSSTTATKCPICGSEDIKQTGGGKSSIAFLVIAAALIVVLLLVLLRKCGTDTLEAKLESSDSEVCIIVGGVEKSKLSSFKVQVLDGATEVGCIDIDATEGKATWSLQHALPGLCYNFRILDKAGDPARVDWTTENRYCMEDVEDDDEDVVLADLPDIEYTAVPNRKTKKYSVQLTLNNGSNAFEWAIDAAWQKSNSFNDIMPGEHTIAAKLGNDKVETIINLPDIDQNMPPELTKEEIDNVFRNVANGNMSQGSAQQKLAPGRRVDLKNVIVMSDGTRLATLTDVLQEAEQSESKFEVIDFQLDPNTNKIKTKTLSIRVTYDGRK